MPEYALIHAHLMPRTQQQAYVTVRISECSDLSSPRPHYGTAVEHKPKQCCIKHSLPARTTNTVDDARPESPQSGNTGAPIDEPDRGADPDEGSGQSGVKYERAWTCRNS